MNLERTRKCLRQLEHIHDFNLTNRNPGSAASLLAATLYQVNPDRKHKLWNIGSTDVRVVRKELIDI
jgi:hypothetical protein